MEFDLDRLLVADFQLELAAEPPGPGGKPQFVQVLETGSRPEGLLAIPNRNLFVSANEGDGTISIFAGKPGNPR